MILGAHRASTDLCSLEPGTHLCALDPDSRSLDRIAATFVGQGLAAGDQMMHIGSDEQVGDLLAVLPARVEAQRALRTGQLLVRSFEEAYGATSPVDLLAVADGFRLAAVHARKRGFPGLRVAARMDDLPALLGSVEDVVAWERMATGLQREVDVSSVCLYDTSALDHDEVSAIEDVHAGHPPDDEVSPLATFIAVDEPWGLRITGEMDQSNRDLLQRAVLSRAAVSPRLWLDLSRVTSADVGTLTRLRSIAAALPDNGHVVLVRPPAVVRRVLEASGLEHARLRVED
ncbi:hypothetical protein GCM10023339_17780 [Alloalcanivorax gelatiniphagus]